MPGYLQHSTPHFWIGPIGLCSFFPFHDATDRRCLLAPAAEIEIEDHREDDSNHDNLERERWHRAPRYTRGLAAVTATTGQGSRAGLECGRPMRLDR
jgi:hypothetical protein